MSNSDLLILQDGHCFRDQVLNLCTLEDLNKQYELKSGNFETLINLSNNGPWMTIIPYLHSNNLSPKNIQNIKMKKSAMISVILASLNMTKDGILELLIAHGENGNQILTLYKADIKKTKNFIRVKALNKNGAPARGATVTLISNLRNHSKTIDSGSGYLCQMEPVAHYGIREGEKDFKVEIKWTNGKVNKYKIDRIGKTYIFEQSKMSISPS